MYSVIIQSQKSMEAYNSFQPMFYEAINNNKIGICKWIESGTTIDTAVPGLADLTDDKEEWRAIIIRYEDERAMSSFESNEFNPYDFIENKDSKGRVEESNIPLVRLTQMLGGVPAPETAFLPEIIRENNKAPRTIYKSVIDPEEEKTYKELCEKYDFNGKLPSSIIILTARVCPNKEKIDKAWSIHRESESSEFWKRNRYPSMCRFLVFDYEKRGSVQKDADDFNFWMTAMLISTNKIDSATLQAYRLYRIKSVFEKEKMLNSLQDSVDSLKKTKQIIEDDIQKDIEKNLSNNTELPKYKVEVSVPYSIPKNLEYYIPITSFRLFSDGASTDIGKWEHKRKNIEKSLSKCVLIAERALDRTADKMRNYCKFDEDEVSTLGKYQCEDLERETNELYRNIVKTQAELPTGMIDDNSEIHSVSKKIKNYLRSRITGKSAFVALFITLLLVTLTQIPAIIDLLFRNKGSIYNIGCSIGIEFAIILGISLFVVIFQKIKLNELLKKYNLLIKELFNKVTDKATDYSKYMSNIASHSRGRSYLDITSKRTNYQTNSQFSKYRLIKSIDIMIGRIRVWTVAYHLPVDFTALVQDDDSIIDISLFNIENALYNGEADINHPVAVNNSGIIINSPFTFVKKLEIEREELYDD